MARLRLVHSVTSFVILFPGRCGGTWLFTIIGSSSFARLHEESLKNAYNMAIEKIHGPEIASLIQENLMREYLSPNRFTKATAFGFSTQFWHVRSAERLEQLLKGFNAKIISLTRTNRVKHALSFFSGENLHNRIGSYHIFRSDTGDPARMKSFAPDPGGLLEKARELEAWSKKQAEFINGLGLEVLSFSYEEMLSDISIVADKTYEFLGLPDRNAAVLNMLVKNMDDDLRTALPNYEDIRRIFAGTEFEQFLE